MSFQLFISINGLIFDIFPKCFPESISSWFNVSVVVYWEHLLSLLLMRFIATFFVFYPIKRIYVWSTKDRIYYMKPEMN